MAERWTFTDTFTNGPVRLGEVRPSTFALADDLTGAIEIGAKFADYGLTSVVVTKLSSFTGNESDVQVIDTETRHLDPVEAGARVGEMAARALESGASLVFKKTDSTLRGNIGAELRAIAEVFRERIVYAPAYPDMGRTVRAGELQVWGTPVHQTEFARDPLNPIHDSRIEGVLGGLNALVLDGECNADLDAAAKTILAAPPPRVCAGPAALAGALAPLVTDGVRRNLVLRKVRRCLVVNGSLHPVSLRQIQWAENAGLFDKNWVHFDELVEGVGIERAMRIGERVSRILSSGDFDGLIVFGGDTAFGIHETLGALPFEPQCEVAAGVPLSRSAGLSWVTKAGGFGAEDVLGTIKRSLT